MFWKKKDKKDKDEELEIILDSDKRGAYRVMPPSNEPVIFYVGNEALTAFDVSAGGASFQAPSGVQKGQVIPLRFRLPYIEAVVQARFKIYGVDKGVVRGAFENLSPQAEEKIHRYALEYQKRYTKLMQRKTKPT